MLNQDQLNEIREIATFIIKQRLWDNLPWDYASDGAFPLKPTSQEIEDEFNILKIKVSRILESNSIDREYDNKIEHLRMLFLENASTFNVF